MTIINKQIVLASRPEGTPREENFRLVKTPLRKIREGEFLVRNLYVSLDAGFRNWMNEGSGDNVLPAMELDAPVMGLTLGRVTESRHPDFRPGDLLMVRRAWEEYSICDAGEWSSRLPEDPPFPLSYYLGILGDTGLSAYFGLTDIGKPQPGETVLVSAAGGAVGSVAGQIANLKGARTVGIAGSDEKCRRLEIELGYDQGINRRGAGGLDGAIAEACPQGIDVYFDNVGGSTLQAALAHLAPGARIVLCGAITSYGATEPQPGPSNLFELITKEARMEGFMCHFRHDRYDEARGQLGEWLQSGQLKAVEYMLDGIENTARAFCEMFEGRNFGKTVVRVFPDG
jgi:NADPH-dependent curcumin reductase CurA